MADTKQTKTIGEYHAASELARRGWAPALTRDGLERTDILAVFTDPAERLMIEVQVKAATWPDLGWWLGDKCQQPSLHSQEFFVLVAVPDDLALAPRNFIVPRSHVWAAAWIDHMNWLTDPAAPLGRRKAPVSQARVKLEVFAGYEDRWELLHEPEDAAPVLLPQHFRELALGDRVGLPPGHPWRDNLPVW